MSRIAPALAGVAIALLAACTPEQPAEPAAGAPSPAASATNTASPAADPSAPASTDPLAGTDATAVESTPVLDGGTPSFDRRAFAGTFSAGADRLELGPDGSFVLGAAGAPIDGTWAAEDDESRIRLDPNSKSEPDRVFAMTSHDELTALDAGGQPATGAAAMSLKREGGTAASQ